MQSQYRALHYSASRGKNGTVPVETLLKYGISDLCFLDGCRLTVTHWTNVKPLFSLQIALSEELCHDSFGPLLVER